MNTVTTEPRPDQAGVRATNLAVVLRHVRAAAPCTRAEIAALTGLTTATVSSLVAELIERRMLREPGLTESRIGRPASLLVVDGSAYVGIGVEIGADTLTAVGLDLAGRRVLTWRRSLSTVGKRAGLLVAQTAWLVRQAAARVRAEGGTVVGLNVAVPGTVDSAGVVRRAPALAWTDLELRAGLEHALGTPDYPIGVDSDGTLGAVAEYRYGALAGTDHLMYLAGPPGGGVGVVSGGVPLHGANGHGPTIGHIRIAASGPPCACGRRGCLDAIAGLDTLLRRAGAEPNDASVLDVEVAQLARRARAGDTQVLAALAEAGSWLEYTVSTLLDLFNPAAVLLGGHYAPLAPWLLPALATQFRASAAAADAGGLQIAASTLGYLAPALGGAAVALDAIEMAHLIFARTAAQPSA